MDYMRIEESVKQRQHLMSVELTSGPIQARGCHDVLCSVLYMCSWVAVVVIGGIAFTRGHPHYLAAPFDSTGQQCGYSPGYQSHPYGYFDGSNYNRFACISHCPTDAREQVSCMYNHTVSDCSSFGRYPTLQIISLCYPIGDTIDIGLNFMDKSMSDVIRTWGLLLGMLFVACLLSACNIVCLQKCGACVVWAVIIVFECILSVFGILALTNSESIVVNGYKVQGQYILSIGYGCFSLVGLSLLVLLCNLRKVKIATLIIQTTATFIKESFAIIMIPIVSFIVIGVYFAVWVVTVVYIFSCGSIKQCGTSPYACIDWDVGVKRSLLYFFFVLFWNCEIAIGLTQYLIAAKASNWYFKKHRPILTGAIRQFGSIVFGALILTIVQMLRICLQILHKVQERNKMSLDRAKNKMMRLMIRCMECCLACFDQFFRFLSHTAFITMAITGEGFCAAAKQGFSLVMRSYTQYAILNGVGRVLMFFTRLLVAVTCSLITYLVIQHQYAEVYSAFLPTLLCFIVCYVVASVVMDVYAVGADTILLCYCIELDVIKGYQMVGPTQLKETLDMYRN